MYESIVAPHFSIDTFGQDNGKIQLHQHHLYNWNTASKNKWGKRFPGDNNVLSNVLLVSKYCHAPKFAVYINILNSACMKILLHFISALIHLVNGFSYLFHPHRQYYLMIEMILYCIKEWVEQPFVRLTTSNVLSTYWVVVSKVSK